MEISRRSFIKGAGLAGAGFAAAGLAGCSAMPEESTHEAMPETGAAVEAPSTSWETPPEIIGESLISETIDTEICILGAGMSGVVAAAVAAEHGASVVVVQNKESIHSQGSGAAAFNSRRQTEQFDDEFRSELVRLKSLYEGGLVNHELVMLWLDRSGEAVDWVLDRIEEDGVTAGFDVYENWREADDQAKTCPISAMWGGPDAQGSMAIISALAPRAEAMGAQFVYNTTARQLVREEGPEGRVVAALGEKKDGTYLRVNASKAVIVCTGGYEANEQMRDKYLSHANRFRALSDNQGEGLQMGLWVGADIDPAPHASNIHYNYLPSDPFGSGLPWLRVNKEGQRLGNEDIAYSFLPFLDIYSEEAACYQIFDADYDKYYPKMVDHGAGIFRSVPSPQFIADAVSLQTTEDTSTWSDLDKTWQYYLEMGSMVKANTLEELASQLGIAYEPLQKTIERYNELYDSGCDVDFGKKPERMHAIRKAPFFGIRREACVLGTLNGLVINTHMQVLDRDRKVIPGLYAAGNASGGRFFGGIAQAMVAPATTISRALVWGYLAALDICVDR